MDVHVGQLCDPDELPGLAHFCEHLLFMGTEAYPSENEYSEFLAAHAGASNAFTSADHTNYYFDVNADHLEGAFDRFIHFFIDPLFSASCTERELLAVDSEHRKNLQSDGWRIHQLDKDLCDPSHPYAHFGTGSIETLRDEPARRGIDVREELLKFHARYYSANIMTLVILGKEPVEQLARWVVDKASAIKNISAAVPTFDKHPLSEAHLLTEIRIKPVKDLRELRIVFPLPDLTPQYLCKPTDYVSHLVGHESEGSWAQELSAGSHLGAKGFEFFTIAISLTEKGSKHHEEIVKLVFAYLEVIRNAGPVDWIYEESKNLSDVFFRFAEKTHPSSFVSRVAGHLHDYPPEHALCGPRVMFQMDRAAIAHVLTVFINSDFDSNGWDAAKWYGTEYKCTPLSEDLKTKETRPTIIIDTPTVRLWHKKDDTFWVPKAQANLLLKSPLAYATSVTAIHAQLYARLVEDAMNEYTYFAEVAGLSMALKVNPDLRERGRVFRKLTAFIDAFKMWHPPWNDQSTTDGIELTVRGYNDKLPLLVTKVVEAIKTLRIDAERFVAIKEEAGRQLKNFAMEQPYAQVTYYVSHATQERLWTADEKLAILE
ncbi:Insulinase (Peptidase M16), partial [Cladochytrium tenue]